MLRLPALDLSPLKFPLDQVNNRSTKRKRAATKQLYCWRSNRAGRMMRVMGPSPPRGGLDPFSVEAARSESMQCPSKRAGSIGIGLRGFCYFGSALTRQKSGSLVIK
jgi:hypothetical protein